MKEILTAWITNLLGGFQGSINDLVLLMTQPFNANANINVVITSVNTAVKGFAITIVSICFLIEILKTATALDHIRWEDLFRVLIKYALARSVLTYTMPLLTAIYSEVGELIVTTSKLGGTNFSDNMAKTIVDAIPDGLIGQLGFLFGYFLSLVVIWIAKIGILVIGYGRMMQIYLYLAVAPLPMSFIPLESTAHITKKFILNFSAVCLHGLFIVISSKLFLGLIGDLDTSTPFKLMEQLALATLTLLVVVAKSGSIAKEIIAGN